MDISQIQKQLQVNLDAISALVSPVSAEQAVWKPSPDDWSILEVINHLYDEEMEDFPARIRFILDSREGKWPSIDPRGWVTERRYNQRQLAESVQNLINARENNLTWLRGLEHPDWGKTYPADFGPLSAGDLCASWVAHDFLHLRQLIELNYYFHNRRIQPYSPLYAGDF
jgi:hypothetical protein